MDNILMRNRMLGFVNVVMRVPPLFIIDELLRIGMGMPEDNLTLDSTYNNYRVEYKKNSTFGGFIPDSESLFIQLLNLNAYFLHTYVTTTIIIKFIACCFGILVSLYTFMLWTGHLIIVYMYLISIGTIFLSYWANVTTMKAIVAYTMSYDAGGASILDDILSLNVSSLINNGPGLIVLQNYLLQSFLAFVFCYIHMAPRHPVVQKLLVVSFLAPSLIGIHPLPTSVLHHAPVFAALLPLLLCKFTIWYNSITILKIIYSSYKSAHNFISNYGLSALAEMEWMRLNVPNVLRTFWILRVSEQIIQILNNNPNPDTINIYTMIKTLLVNGCETLTALLGMTSIISSICHYVGCFFRWILLTEDEEEKSIGTVCAILFYILALQTGLTSLERDKRLERLLKNFSLLITALLHFVHNIVYPVLMSLSASHNPALRRHLRALTVCLFLIVFPTTLLVFLWTNFTISTWLLAVTIFSIEVIVKVFVSLAVYSLFLYDAYRSTFWEPLDDCLYIIRSFGNTVEFAFGIILFFNGVWILLFESSGAIRAVMMGIHAYFNIWNEAKAGWSVFMKRRTAVNKINILPEATDEQLKKLNDVCAICYQEMNTARVTKCNHFFHGVCLRKWLYVQDRCPLCHDILYKIELNDVVKSEPVVNNAEEIIDNEISNNNNPHNNSTTLQSIISPNTSGINSNGNNNNNNNEEGVVEEEEDASDDE